MRQSRNSFLNAGDNTHVAILSIFLWNTRWHHGCSHGETKNSYCFATWIQCQTYNNSCFALYGVQSSYVRRMRKYSSLIQDTNPAFVSIHFESSYAYKAHNPVPLPSPSTRTSKTNNSQAQSACARLLFVCSNLVGSGGKAWKGNWILHLNALPRFPYVHTTLYDTYNQSCYEMIR